MKKFSGYDAAREKANFSGSAKLPVGGYVVKIQDVRYEEGQNGNSDRIVLAYDIAEGEYQGFFKNQFEENTQEDKKWKGRTAIYIPKDDGSEKDEWTQNTFAKWTAAFENSNEGYHWDWQEKKWKNLLVGVVYGEVGTVIEGKNIKYTECRFPCSVTDVREKKYKIPKFKTKNGYTEDAPSVTGSEDFMQLPEGKEQDIPF